MSMILVVRVVLTSFITPAHRIAFLAWIPGQGVQLDYAATIEILIQQLDNQRMLFKLERCVSC